MTQFIIGRKNKISETICFDKPRHSYKAWGHSTWLIYTKDPSLADSFESLEMAIKVAKYRKRDIYTTEGKLYRRNPWKKNHARLV